MKRKLYIVLNAAKNEGYVTDDPEDAEQAQGNARSRGYASALADEFKDHYGDEDTYLFEIDLEIGE